MSANVSQSYYLLGQAPLDAKLIFKNKQAFCDRMIDSDVYALTLKKG